ncbi:MAG: DEAD/DEAH box helicase [Bacillota bacterium]|nr:DEAD/DEAH box helicase [Bacillota bacterium]
MKPNLSFYDLGIPNKLVEKLHSQDIKIPTDIQKKLIPYILEEKDIIGQSPTGTGKTLAYLLPILTKLNPQSKHVQALILAPTRELAMQITKLANLLTENTEVMAIPILGETNTTRQLESLKKKPQLIIGTPGRILEFIKLRKINSQTIKTITVDEVDKMWSRGFKEDVLGIIKTTLRDRQIVMISATIPADLKASKVLNNPIEVKLDDEKVPSTIKHIYFMTDEKNKAALLQRLINFYMPAKAIIFINSNEGIQTFVRRFIELGFKAAGLHSGQKQQERKLVLSDFRLGKFQLLITSDLFARGMDVKDVEVVFNFDLPNNDEHYIHRVGRTGRAGSEGLAINFVTQPQKFIMSKYEKMLNIKIQEYGISKDEKNFKVFPVKFTRKRAKAKV